MRRRGIGWMDVNPYLHLINMSWPAFLSTVFASYIVLNALFALAYFLVGSEQIPRHGSPHPVRALHERLLLQRADAVNGRLWNHAAPRSVATNSIAAVEAMLGLMRDSLSPPACSLKARIEALGQDWI